VRTVIHFFPKFREWLNEVPDPRDPVRTVYNQRFLLWISLFLFVCKLGSRRQIDYEFRDGGPLVLLNLNRLAGTQQTTLPSNKTVDNYLSQAGGKALPKIRKDMVYRLLRMRVLEGERVQGRYMVLIDGTGYLVFRQRHCEHCLTQCHGAKTLYLHQVLEAKLLGPNGMVVSIATQFIDNRDAAGAAADASEEKRKQDCELKALRRLAARLREEFPRLPMCVSGDGLNACGEGFQIAKDYNLSFIHVFKEGRIPTLWNEFQELLKLCPEQKVEVQTPAKVKQEYRWINNLDYVDSDKRIWKLTALQCEETHPDGSRGRWAWLTNLEVNQKTASEVATCAGRVRWCIENQGFNVQKNSGLNLEHAYSEGDHWEVYYYLLQIAHLLLQLVEKGSLLRQLAKQQGQGSAVAMFGSLKNMAARMLESLRNLRWPEDAYATEARIQIRFNSS
jgi:hypothetical protein